MTLSWNDWGNGSSTRWLWWSKLSWGDTKTGAVHSISSNWYIIYTQNSPSILDLSFCRMVFLRKRRAAVALQNHWRAYRGKQKVWYLITYCRTQSCSRLALSLKVVKGNLSQERDLCFYVCSKQLQFGFDRLISRIRGRMLQSQYWRQRVAAITIQSHVCTKTILTNIKYKQNIPSILHLIKVEVLRSVDRAAEDGQEGCVGM